MTLVNRVEKLEEFMQENKEFVIEFIQAYNKEEENSLNSSAQIKKQLQEFQDKDKLLRIGIVGRVKAGKSSLLNALIFDGKDILPKAATPMTAALTTIKYSETIKAELDFFTQDDINCLKQEYYEYQKHLSNLKSEEIAREKTKSPARQDINKAIKRAEKAAKNSPYEAGADQYKRISDSGLNIDDLAKAQNIYAVSSEALVQELFEFVGANGKYMPFTKSVTLYLPQEELKGLEIIDTPGTNDPVKSRSKRTYDKLSECDVVLMISPTGQFISAQDKALISTMSNKQGSSIYLIASQCDTQLLGAEYREYNIKQILDDIRSKLIAQAKEILIDQAVGDTSDKFKCDDLVLSSGPCYGLAKDLEYPDNWDDTQQHIYQLLERNFPQDFSDQEKILATLNALSNITKIREIFDEVSKNKSKIIAEKSKNYQKGQEKSFLKMLEELKQFLAEKENELKATNIESLKEQQRIFNNLMQNVEDTCSKVYRRYSSELIQSLPIVLENALRQQISNVPKTKQKGITTHKESYTRKVGERSTSKWWNPFTWGDTESIYETCYRTVEKSYSYVTATPITEAMKEILTKVNVGLNNKISEFTSNSKRKLNDQLRQELMKLDNSNLNSNRIQRTIDTALSILPKSDFKIDDLPEDLCQHGILKEKEGDLFLEKVEEYLYGLESNVDLQIKSYIKKLNKALSKINLGSDLIQIYHSELERLERDLKDKESVLEKYQKIQTKIKEI